MRRQIDLAEGGARVVVNEDTDTVSLALSNHPVYASVRLTPDEAALVAGALLEVVASVQS